MIERGKGCFPGDVLRGLYSKTEDRMSQPHLISLAGYLIPGWCPRPLYWPVYCEGAVGSARWGESRFLWHAWLPPAARGNSAVERAGFLKCLLPDSLAGGQASGFQASGRSLRSIRYANCIVKRTAKL